MQELRHEILHENVARWSNLSARVFRVLRLLLACAVNDVGKTRHLIVIIVWINRDY
jgi:hypothetical protein